MAKFGEQFLHKKDQKLHTSKPVELEMERKKVVGEEVSQKPADKISDWLEVIKKTHTGHRDNPEVLERIKDYYHKENVIKQEDIPESYYENQKKLAREQGHGDIEITREMKAQLSEVIIKDQQTTLDNWTNYFTSPDADAYPMWAKYWAFTNMLKLSSFDKEKHAFGKRDKNTVAPFPDLNREALAYVVDVVAKSVNDPEKSKKVFEWAIPELNELLKNQSFGKLYAYAIEKVTPTEKNELENTKGEWKKYNQNSNHMPLVESLQGYGTGWCTAGESTAKTQLQGGDFYVYYSYDKDNKPTIPRVAIRMQGDEIGEVRGIAPDQNMDPYIGDVLKAKMKEFSDGEKYEKKSADMKLLTEIDNKTKKEEKLTKDELIFLYEINSKIEGFGYQRDPRIKELLDQRNPKEDAPIVLDCEPKQIAYSEKEINENTKAYIGVWNPTVLKNLPKNIEYIYTKFPDQKVFLKEIVPDKEITSAKIAIKKLEAEGHQVGDYAKDMLSKVDWKEKLKNSYEIVSFSVGELFGDTQMHTYAEIKAKAQESGLLDLVPANLAPEIRSNYEKSGQWTNLAMDAMRVRDGNPLLFHCNGDGSKSWLDDDNGHGDDEWDVDFRFFFARK